MPLIQSAHEDSTTAGLRLAFSRARTAEAALLLRELDAGLDWEIGTRCKKATAACSLRRSWTRLSSTNPS